MRREIPAVQVVVCDRCAAASDKGGRFKREGTVIVKSNVLDQLGDPVAGGAVPHDLCDQCTEALEAFLQPAGASIMLNRLHGRKRAPAA